MDATQILFLSLKKGIESIGCFSPGLDVLIRSGIFIFNSTVDSIIFSVLIKAKVCNLWAVMRINSVAVISVNSFSFNLSRSVIFSIYVSRISVSQVSEYLGRAGLILSVPRMNLDIRGSFERLFFDIREMAALDELRVPYFAPSLNRDVRKLMTSVLASSKASILFS